MTTKSSNHPDAHAVSYNHKNFPMLDFFPAQIENTFEYGLLLIARA